MRWTVIETMARGRVIKVGDRTVFRHTVSNFNEVLTCWRVVTARFALSGHFTRAESIATNRGPHSLSSGSRPLSGPPRRVPAIPRDVLSVKDRVIDDAKFHSAE